MKRGRPTTLPEPWRNLSERCGGVAELARRLGLGADHVTKLAKGRYNMRPATAELLRMVAAEKNVDFSEYFSQKELK